jgi:hypothetical protein
VRRVTNHPQPSNGKDVEPLENSEYASAESERPDLLARWHPEPEQQTPPKQLAVRQDGGVTDRFTTSGTSSDGGRPLALLIHATGGRSMSAPTASESEPRTSGRDIPFSCG